MQGEWAVRAGPAAQEVTAAGVAMGAPAAMAGPAALAALAEPGAHRVKAANLANQVSRGYRVNPASQAELDGGLRA